MHNLKPQLSTLGVNVFQCPTMTLRTTSTDACFLNNGTVWRWRVSCHLCTKKLTNGCKIQSFLTQCFVTGPQSLRKRVIHRVRSRASAFKFKNLLSSLGSTRSCLILPPRLPVNSIFPWITCFRRQFIRKMWWNQLPYLRYILCGMLLSSLTECNTSSFSTR